MTAVRWRGGTLAAIAPWSQGATAPMLLHGSTTFHARGDRLRQRTMANEVQAVTTALTAPPPRPPKLIHPATNTPKVLLMAETRMSLISRQRAKVQNPHTQVGQVRRTRLGV